MFFHIASVERQVHFYKNINNLSLGSRYQMMDYQCFDVQGDLLAARKCNLFCLPSSISGHNTFRYFFDVFLSIIHSHILIFLFFIRAVLSFFAHNIFYNFSTFLSLCPLMVNYCRDWRVTDQVSIEPDCFWTKTGTP